MLARNLRGLELRLLLLVLMLRAVERHCGCVAALLCLRRTVVDVRRESFAAFTPWILAYLIALGAFQCLIAETGFVPGGLVSRHTQKVKPKQAKGKKGGGSHKGPNTRSLHAAMADAARSRLCAVSRRRLSLPSHHTGRVKTPSSGKPGVFHQPPSP